MELIIKLNEQEANMVLAGLGELPAKHSIELILNVKNQCEEQIKAAKENLAIEAEVERQDKEAEEKAKKSK
jgi:hypothetical protein